MSRRLNCFPKLNDIQFQMNIQKYDSYLRFWDSECQKVNFWMKWRRSLYIGRLPKRIRERLPTNEIRQEDGPLDSNSSPSELGRPTDCPSNRNRRSPHHGYNPQWVSSFQSRGKTSQGVRRSQIAHIQSHSRKLPLDWSTNRESNFWGNHPENQPANSEQSPPWGQFSLEFSKAVSTIVRWSIERQAAILHRLHRRDVQELSYIAFRFFRWVKVLRRPGFASGLDSKWSLQICSNGTEKQIR
jgi:hypothetical protein